MTRKVYNRKPVIRVSMSRELKDWLDFATSVSHRAIGYEIAACVAECKRQSEALNAPVKTSDLIDALRVMVMAWNCDYQKWLRNSNVKAGGPLTGDVIFPAKTSGINSVSGAMKLLNKIDGIIDGSAN